ncbi:hypothetical protein [Cellulomonas sp. SLBN-39]|uniref:hypothetical protein n=1 Tax=Cellulomonas sp. SLBN-39 TaxID=2768446 RepID=UPI0011518D1C|nr:hypothetical protein [Cellulomonas sp. SLBN-39]
MQATLTTGETTTFSVALPDVCAALILKAYAYRGRFAPRDALDVWRLLETARQAELGRDDWPTGSGARDAAHVLHQFFAAPGGRGAMSASPDPAVQARVRALALAVVPAPLT